MSAPNVQQTVQETIVLGPSFYAQNVVLEDDYLVTPEGFGAVGNGIADDSTAVLMASTLAASRGVAIQLQNNYFIGSSITLPSNIESSGGQLIWSGTTTVTVNGKCLLTDEQAVFNYPSTAHIALTADTETSMGWFVIKNDGSQDCTHIIQDLVNSAGSLNRSIIFPAGTYACSNSVISYNHQFDGYGFLKMGPDTIPAGKVVNTSFQMSIPANFINPNAALGFLQGRYFGDGVTVTCNIADGTYTWPEVFPQHAQGQRISFIGDVANRNNVVLQFDATNSGNGFHLANGYSLGLIDGMTITMTNAWVSHGVWNTAITPYGAGVLCTGSSHIQIGSNVYINKCYYGVRALEGGTIAVGSGVLVNEAGDVGYHAYNGGSIDARGTFATNCSDAAAGLGHGYLAELGGTIQCEVSSSSGNNQSGFGAFSNGAVWAISSQATNNTWGFYASNGGHVIGVTYAAEGQSVASGNQFGVRAQMSGHIEFNGSLSHNNTLDGINVSGGTIDAGGATTQNNGGAGQGARYNGVIYGTVTSTGNTLADFATNGGIIGANYS